jgi:hypothetical protein
MTTLDATDQWPALFRSISKGNRFKAYVFGRHALNTTSVVAVSSNLRHTEHQARANTPLVDTVLSQLDSDVTTLLPDRPSIDMMWLQAALDRQSMWSASTITSILENIDWSARQPGEIALGVRLALALQAPLLGRIIAARGHHLYPSDDELAKLNRVLAPPTTTISKATTRPDIHANLAWLGGNYETYQGQWVALDDGRLLANAGSIDALIAQVGDVRDTNILITQVW